MGSGIDEIRGDGGSVSTWVIALLVLALLRSVFTYDFSEEYADVWKPAMRTLALTRIGATRDAYGTVIGDVNGSTECAASPASKTMAKRRNSCGSVPKKCRPPSQLPNRPSRMCAEPRRWRMSAPQSGMFGSGDAADGGHEFAPGLALRLQDVPSRGRQPVISAAGRTVVRVYAEAPPGPGFEAAEPGLEDVYFSTMAGHVGRRRARPAPRPEVTA